MLGNMSIETRAHQPIVSTEATEIRGVHDQCEEKADHERDGYGWPIMGRGFREYEDSFAPVFYSNIHTVLEEKQAKGEPTAMLDFMGFGAMFYEAQRENPNPAFSHGISVSLNHWRKEAKHPVTENQRIAHVTGNVLYEATWQTLNNVMRMLGESRFGIIIWAAAGGVNEEFITSRPDIFQEILQRLWARLSKQNGMLLVEVPPHIMAHYYDRFTAWWNTLKQLFPNQSPRHPLFQFHKYSFSNDGVMRLEKTPLLPVLPPF